MKIKNYGWIIVSAMMILIVMGTVAATSRFLPERCNLGPEFTCEKYEVSSFDGKVRILFRNNVGETIHGVSVINAEWVEETIDPSRCNDISANTYEAGKDIEVICYFDQTLFPPSGSKMKFEVNMEYISQGETKPLTAEIFLPLDDDYPYASSKYVYRSSGFIIYVILTLIILAFYVGAIFRVEKNKKMKIWEKVGLRVYFAGAIIALIAFTLYTIGNIEKGYIEFIAPIPISIVALIVSLCLPIFLYIFATIISYVINRETKKKK